MMTNLSRCIRRLIVAAPLAGLIAAQPQEADWDIHRDPRQDAVAAYLPTTAGPLIVVRCNRNVLTAYVAELPTKDSDRRQIGVAFGDDEISLRDWTQNDDGTAAFSDMPAPFARSLRKGGRLDLRLPGAAEGGRTLIYRLDLPPSSAAIDETLTRCDRPLVDPRDVELDSLGDDGLPSNIRWRTRPRPEYPSNRYARGFAVVTCMSRPDGGVRDCVVETEHPHDGRFGKATLDAMGRARLVNSDDPDGPVPLTRIGFRTDFIIGGYESREDRERMRLSREAERQERGG